MTLQEEAREHAEMEARRLFAGRMGHGGKVEIVYRVLRERALQDVIYGAFLAGAAHQARATDQARMHR